MKKPVPKTPVEKPLTAKQLDEQLAVAEKSLALAEANYTAKLFNQLVLAEQGLQPALADKDESNWTLISQGGQYVDEKNLIELNRNPQIMRRQSYRFWRLHPHGRSILRNFVRFIIGREFGLDFDDEQHGTWNDDHTKLELSSDDSDPLLVRELWEDFSERNSFIQKAKELVLRTFRDGEMFLRRFVKDGRVTLRFIEPEKIGWGHTPTLSDGKVLPDDIDENDIYSPLTKDMIGQATKLSSGIEYLSEDPEIIVAYWVRYGDKQPERIPAKDIIHTKPLADSNDLRGIPLLEVVAKRLTNYDQWEEYRMVLNKMRTAIALVRKIDGTSAQASALLANRASSRPQPKGLEPVTTSGRREPMFQAGTVLNPSPGVTYDFLAPKLEARDAGEDGRRFLLSICAGVGLPEMLITGDWSNSNYASSVESRTPAVREWEDWQDFFEPVFKKIYRWVVQAGMDLALPKDTSQTVTVKWPQLVAKDELKSSQRGQILQAGGILSKTTWAAEEDLIYQDELDNMRLEAELEVAQTTPGQEDDVAAAARYVRNARRNPGGAGAPGYYRGQSRPGDTVEAQAIIESLVELREAVDSTIEDPTLHAAMTRYMSTAQRVAQRVVKGSRRSRRDKAQWRAKSSGA